MSDTSRMRPIESAMRWAKSSTNEEHRKIAKFILVGVFRTAVGYGLYLLVLWVGLHYELALTADYVFALSTGYVMNRFWTFSNQGQPEATLLKYVAAYGLAFGLESLTLFLLVAMVGMGAEFARIPGLVLATVASYLLQRYWVFQGH